MKKTLFLSAVASTMIMAGGDFNEPKAIEPVVETPSVEAPVVEAAPAASGWDFNGQGVVYYQTRDRNGNTDLFDKAGATGAAGIQVRGVNKDLFAGVGAGFELTGISDLYLFPEVVSGFAQTDNPTINAQGDLFNKTQSADSGAEITQAYLTYGLGNTSFKLGRQTLPKALSPFAFSESWNVFKNSFDAALVVNSDLPDTTLVGAYVRGANQSTNLSNFTNINTRKGVYMVTLQNKSLDGLTLTGSYYYAPEIGTSPDDLSIAWGDATYKISDYVVALQGGYIFGDPVKDKETMAYGGKIGADFGMFDASVAFSAVGDKKAAIPVKNFGGVKTPFYTQMILNQGVIQTDSQYVKAAAGAKLLGGKLGVAYGLRLAADDATLDKSNPSELDVTYATKVFNDTTTLFAGYVMSDPDVSGVDAENVVRVWGRYNF